MIVIYLHILLHYKMINSITFKSYMGIIYGFICVHHAWYTNMIICCQIICVQIICGHLSNHMWSNHMWTTIYDHHIHVHYKMTTQLHSNHIWETYMVSYVSIMYGTQIWSYVIKSYVFKSYMDIFQIICDQIIYERSYMIVIYLYILVHYKMIIQLHSNHTWKSYMISYVSNHMVSHIWSYVKSHVIIIYTYINKWNCNTFKSYMEIICDFICE